MGDFLNEFYGFIHQCREMNIHNIEVLEERSGARKDKRKDE
ncbi:hypothetical protein [Romboutsia ilealis]|nr:hypothetical protein [Romboutsia ilealis]